jgi:hypothetical protein
MIRIVSGTKRLVAGIRTYFESHNVTAAVSVGPRELERKDNQGPGGTNRVVIVPFDPKSGAGGTVRPPVHVGPLDVMSEVEPEVRVGSVRAIADWQRLMLVEVWARDAEDPENDELNTYAVEDLLEQTKRAFAATGLADVEWGATIWVTPPERHNGLAVRVAVTFSHPLFDAPIEVAFPGLKIDRTVA